MQNWEESEVNFGKIKRILWIVLWFNVGVAISKVFLGIFSGAISILSDGIHSVFDSATNIVGLVGIKIAEKPADKNHPYGHRKYEAIAAMIILFFLIITGWEISKSVFEKISNPAAIHHETGWFLVSLITLICCLIIDVIVAKYEFKKGEELKSTILRADARHTKQHYITTGAVIFGMFGLKIGLPPIIDPVAACVVVFFIGKLAYEIFKETLVVLSDQSLADAEKIKKTVEGISGVKSCHQIRTRGDESHIFLDIHIIVDPDISLEKAHEICHSVSDAVQKNIDEIKDITVHPEPAEPK